MARELLIAIDAQGVRTQFRLDVFQEGDHWTSTLQRLDADGREERDAVAPRFYGVTSEQARRRMVDVLENQYEQVRSAASA